MKMIISNKLLIIENYTRVILITKEKIIVDNFSISGFNLKISKMDDYYIIITGIFDLVNLNEKS